ncbi:MAG: hypothetical protein A3K19_03585 [Lentisphaerae bacterium RIFOXYB12_FULL_65_16]|nr:MAG: hypothetical protein A3K18_30125 [Lentisphaerae bacterium RIFOXYA12_64_32]OGV86596.1 MAG: hypothetical protein A3K19_03585 [Lentisphaerae bacterium RIFOXYB12_FULL_65_16]
MDAVDDKVDDKESETGRPVRVNPAAAPFVVVSQSRRLSAGQDTIPTPHRRTAPDGLLRSISFPTHTTRTA